MKLNIPAPDEDDEIDMTPMIDCVFLLVLFFMVTSSFIEEAQGFKVTLPHAAKAVTINRENTDCIHVSQDGRYIYQAAGSKEEEIADLRVLLKKLEKLDPEKKKKPFIIRCDHRCEYQMFVQAKNVLIRAGIETIFEEVEVRHDKTQP